MDINKNALAWIVSDDTGNSSKCLWAVMVGLKPKRRHSHPSDGADLGRCLRLLELVPEWKPRIQEMAEISPYWAALVDRWGDLAAAMIADTGPLFDRNKRAERTYSLMKSILGPIEAKDGTIINLGNGASMRF